MSLFDREVVFTSTDGNASNAHFDAVADDLAHVGVLSCHCSAQRATCARVSNEFTLVNRSIHSGHEDLTVNRVQPGVNVVITARFAPSFRSVRVAYEPGCAKNAAQRPVY